MKISEMLKREDFWAINDATLRAFYADSPKNHPTVLAVYPHLNAIVTRFPSAAVKRYLYTEYRVRGNILRRIAAALYTRLMLNTGGLFAARKLRLETAADRDTLIYPCNRKYRFFDFSAGTVTVVPKVGFPTDALAHEIDFRLNHTAPFLLPIMQSGAAFYTEPILNGVPVARLADREGQLQKAMRMWREFTAATVTQLPAKEYAEQLQTAVKSGLQHPALRQKKIDGAAVAAAAEQLLDFVKTCDRTVPVGQSHGDFQAGNIWLENGTGRIFIIDWETVSRRSVWYDEAVLAGAFRSADLDLAQVGDLPCKRAVLLLEELCYRLWEAAGLPQNFGEENFDRFWKKWEKEAEQIHV